jgi:hypothetical protein
MRAMKMERQKVLFMHAAPCNAWSEIEIDLGVFLSA